MRIAVAIERMETWRGGAETSTMELSRLLAEIGHEVQIFTTTNAQSLPNLPVHSVRCPNVLRNRRAVVFAKRAAASMREMEIDIVHAISPLPDADVYQPRGGLLAETMARNVATRPTASARLLKRAMLAMNVKQRAMLEMERRVFRPDGPIIAAVSDYVAAQCARYYKAYSPRVRTIFNGVDVHPFSDEDRAEHRRKTRAEYRLGDDELLLLFVAHNFRLKGLGSLIETLSRLVVSGFKKFHLLVVGRDNVVPYRKRLRSQGLDSFVTFTGPTRRPADLLLGADVCVHPTYYDPCSRVVLEALALGVPVITTSFNGASELIQDGRHGFVIRTPEEVGLWAKRIRDLAEPGLRAKMALSAVELRDKISMRRHVQELDLLFREVVERKGCRSVGAQPPPDVKHAR